MSGAIVGLIFRRFLRRNSIADIADIVPAKISFEGPILMVNGVIITNIGLESTREKYRNECLAIEVIPRDLGAFGIVNDIDVMIDVVKSTPIIETSKGKQSDFSRKTL